MSFFSPRIFGGKVAVQFPSAPEKVGEIKTFESGATVYISTLELIDVLSAGMFANVERSKIVIYFRGHRIKVSAQSSFVVIDNRVYQMPNHALFDGADIYLPMRAFLLLFNLRVAPGVFYDEATGVVVVDLLAFNITNVTIDEKANGTIIRLRTTLNFDPGALAAWSARNGWFYLTVEGGVVDTSAFHQIRPVGVVRAINASQMEEKTAQIAFQIRSEVEDHELIQNRDPSEIVITLRTPLRLTADKIKKLRDSWYIDTVVIDAGHGGKDGGSTGTYGLQEKFVTLDVAKRVGRLVEKYTTTKVIYTRDEDVFVPLWKRTKMANERNGKLFISIHANSNKNRRIRGFETYILRPGKSADAVGVAERENAVIKLEEEISRYDRLAEDNFIIASLMQNAFMKESEDFAAIIQEQLHKSIPSPDRGVKQAGFYVLIGASMPNVLVEVGFLSNPQEERQLRKPGYRQSVAQAIYQGLRRFKDKYERVLEEETQG
ncbi:MAG: N-acetylmuramoyl-L-alanine amidase [Candidatus Neomarinimicrobiota bacterium]